MPTKAKPASKAPAKKAAPKAAKPATKPVKVAEKVSEKNVSKPVKVAPGKQKIRIRIRAFDHTVIDQAVRTILDSAQNTGAFIAGPIPLPTKIKKVTVNRSTFVHKDARDQFEIRNHGRLIDVLEPNAKTVESLSNLNLPSGVDIEIKMMMMS